MLLTSHDFFFFVSLHIFRMQYQYQSCQFLTTCFIDSICRSVRQLIISGFFFNSYLTTSFLFVSIEFWCPFSWCMYEHVFMRANLIQCHVCANILLKSKISIEYLAKRIEGKNHSKAHCVSIDHSELFFEKSIACCQCIIGINTKFDWINGKLINIFLSCWSWRNNNVILTNEINCYQ